MSKPKFKPWAELELVKDNSERIEFQSIYYAIPNGGGLPYESNRIDIHIHRDFISFYSDGAEQSIYFQALQIPHLKKAIAAWNKRAKS